MMLRSLGLKISLLVALVIIIMIGAIVYIVNTRTTAMVDEITSNEAKAANHALALALQEYQDGAHACAEMIANSPEVIEALMDGDEILLRSEIDLLGMEMDIVTLCDTDGNVFMRMHNDKVGDNILNEHAISSALTTGVGASTIEEVPGMGLSTRGSAAITDHSGKIIAAVTCGQDLSLPKYVDEVKEKSDCEVTIFNGDTRMSTTLIDEKGERAIGTKASDEVIDKVLNQGQSINAHIPLFGSIYAVVYTPLTVDGEILGVLFTGVNIDHSLAAHNSMITLVVTAAVVTGAIGLLLTFLCSTLIVSRPLKKIGVFAEKIKSGDLGISSPSASTIDVRSSDETGVLARALEQTYTQLQGYVGEISERMQGLSSGDLTTESTYDFHGDFIQIKNSINGIVRDLNKIISEVHLSSQQVSTGAKQIADGAQSLASGATEQASAVEELSASIVDINKMAKDNMENATSAKDEFQSVGQMMGVCTEQMEQMLSAMQAIDEKSKDILKTTKLIDDIAFQTNILALNAAVEAARAGQHGKGFAVVADEVRNLASKSAEAASETASLLEGSSQSVEEGNIIVGKVNESLHAVAEIAMKSAEMIANVQYISTQQSDAMEQVATGIDQVSQVIHQSSATAEESAASSEEMSGQSELLQEMILQFKLE